jgi:histone H3/H4
MITKQTTPQASSSSRFELTSSHCSSMSPMCALPLALQTSQAEVPLQTKTAVEQAADSDGPTGSSGGSNKTTASTKPVPDAAPLSEIAKNTAATAASQAALAVEKTGELAGSAKEKAIDLKDKTVEVAGAAKDTLINVKDVVQDKIQGAAGT